METIFIFQLSFNIIILMNDEPTRYDNNYRMNKKLIEELNWFTEQVNVKMFDNQNGISFFIR